jgi:hypothetical protein
MSPLPSVNASIRGVYMTFGPRKKTLGLKGCVCGGGGGELPKGFPKDL